MSSSGSREAPVNKVRFFHAWISVSMCISSE